jgi:tetratricopeptide (TPR) repeat protein
LTSTATRRRSPRAPARLPSAPVRPSKRAPILHAAAAIAALLLLVVLSYGNSFNNGFTWDDQQQIVMNPALRQDTPLPQVLFSDVWAFSHLEGYKIYYRPLQTLAYRLTIAVAGVNPAVFHFLSILWMSLAAVLCFAFFWMLTQRIPIAFAAAALFAAHPIHSEAVDWASALPDLGCTAFLLAALMCFLAAYERPQKQEQRRSPRKLIGWAFSLICFAAALLWKETAAVLPLLITAYILLFPAKLPAASRVKHAVLLSLPFWAVLAAYLLLRVRVLGYLTASLRNWQLNPLQLALTAAHLLMQYWWKLLVPLPLNAYHVFSPVTSLSSASAIGALIFLALATVAVFYCAGRIPLLAFATLWVFLTLLPVLDIYAVGRNVLAERYLVLPSVGFCLLLALLAAELLQRIPARLRSPVGAAALFLVASLSVLATRARNPDWQDDATLFAKTLETSPNAPFVLNMVAATVKSDAASSQAAENHYLQALAFASSEIPQDRLQMARACEGLALIYSNRNDFARAVDFLNRVRSIDPADPEVDGEEGLIFAKAGRWDEAGQYLQRAVAASHENENVLNALGIVAQQHTHQLDQAAAYFSRALAIHTAPDDFNASLHNNLGSVYGEQGRYQDAINEFRAAISIAPSDAEYRTNLATALAATSQFDAARSQLRTILSLAPNYPPARDLLRQLPP